MAHANPVWREARTDAEVLARAYRESPVILACAYSASPMWTANAATVSPSADSADGRTHFTAANLKKEQEFHASDIAFHVRVKADGKEKTVTIALKPA